MVFHEGTTLDHAAFDELEHTADLETAHAARSSSSSAVALPVDEDVAAIPFPQLGNPQDGEFAADAAQYEGWPTLNQLEADHIRRTLKETFYNQSAAARLLGIDRKQLARKIRKYDLRIPKLAPGRPTSR